MGLEPLGGCPVLSCSLPGDPGLAYNQSPVASFLRGNNGVAGDQYASFKKPINLHFNSLFGLQCHSVFLYLDGSSVGFFSSTITGVTKNLQTRMMGGWTGCLAN